MGVKKVFENKFITDMAIGFFGRTVCPMLASNTSVCAGGTKNMGEPLLDAIGEAFLDPEYFCEQTLPVCNYGDYKFYHAEEFVNKIIASKP